MTHRTKKELLVIRETTYQGPPDAPRCETCRHFHRPFSGNGNCMAVEIRDRIYSFECHPFGKCDLWEQK